MNITKKAVYRIKQPSKSTDFCPCRFMTTRTRWKSVRIVIKSNYESTTCTFVDSLPWFFSCSVHKNSFKKLKNSTILHFFVKKCLLTFFCWTYFNRFGNCCFWSFVSFFLGKKPSGFCVPYSFR